MDESGVNIDIVFRNGLKDYEVLPPQEVWDNILPSLIRKQRRLMALRVAAVIAVILSLSVFAYRLSMEISQGIDTTLVAFEIGSPDPIFVPSTEKIVVENRGEVSTVNASKTILSEITEDEIPEPVTNKSSSPETVYYRGFDNLSVMRDDPGFTASLLAANSSAKISLESKDFELQYLPEAETMKKTERWSVAAMASPTYFSILGTSGDDVSKRLMDSEKPIMSYSGGLGFRYKINKRLSLQSGLYYASLGQELQGINSYGGFQKYDFTKGDHNFEVLTTNGSVVTSNADVFLASDGFTERILTSYTNDVFDPNKANLLPISNTLRQTFSYLEFPIFLRYKLVDKIIDFNLIGGVSYNFLINNSVYTMMEGNKYPVGETEGLNMITLSSSLGMGMEYNFTNKLSLNLEPTFRYYINPFNEISGSKNHPYSFGIFSGISYKF